MRAAHDPELLDALLPGQLTTAVRRKLPRRHLGRGIVALLIVLRVYVVLAIPLVFYAFIHAMMTAGK